MGNFLFEVPGLSNAGAVYVMSSRPDRTEPLMEHFGTMRSQGLGGYVGSPGDVNGDGFPDYFACGVLLGLATIYSGRDGSVLFEHFSTARTMAPLGDVNRDGFDDFLLGDGNSGEVFYYLGGSFDIRYYLANTALHLEFGASVAVLGDVDEDGHPDYAVGAPAGGWIDGVSGRVDLYSGKEGTFVGRLWGEGAADIFGSVLEAPGDLDGDGFRDLVVGAGHCCSPYPKDGGPGRVYFFNGSTAETLGTVEPTHGRAYGVFVDEAGDIDGNGFADILVGHQAPGQNLMYVIDGFRRETIYSLPYEFPSSGGGQDWNSDDFPDYLARGPLGAPYIELRSGAPPGVEVLGTACSTIPGKKPRIGATGVPRLGERYPIHLTGVDAGLTALLLAGDVLVPLPPGQGTRCTVLVRPRAVFRTSTVEIRPKEGAATIEVAIPASHHVAGFRLHVQWLVLDECGTPVALSRVLRISPGG